ncbi:hypothetical protein LCGC14_2448140 [marine sediment metagenome]|uniref:Uncharacterized protein n=1 Tax=marine sediment metagenome TaxID=412755 RepID=A0A0F9DU09_9ZZZZ
MKKTKLRPVTVAWNDSARYGSWHDARDATYQPMKCKTRGFLLQSNRKIVAIATSIGISDTGELGQVCDVMVIPRSCVTSIRKDRGSGRN